MLPRVRVALSDYNTRNPAKTINQLVQADAGVEIPTYGISSNVRSLDTLVKGGQSRETWASLPVGDANWNSHLCISTGMINHE